MTDRGDFKDHLATRLKKRDWRTCAKSQEQLVLGRVEGGTQNCSQFNKTVCSFYWTPGSIHTTSESTCKPDQVKVFVLNIIRCFLLADLIICNLSEERKCFKNVWLSYTILTKLDILIIWLTDTEVYKMIFFFKRFKVIIWDVSLILAKLYFYNFATSCCLQ